MTETVFHSVRPLHLGMSGIRLEKEDTPCEISESRRLRLFPHSEPHKLEAVALGPRLRENQTGIDATLHRTRLEPRCRRCE